MGLGSPSSLRMKTRLSAPGTQRPIGAPAAAWAVRRDGGDFELRGTDYDTARAAAAYRALGAPVGELFAHRIETGGD